MARPSVRRTALSGLAVAAAFLLPASTASAATGFAYPVEYALPAPTDVVADDMNGDGDADMVSAGGGFVAVSLGLGDGTFGSAETFALEGTQSARIAVADIDADGDLDVAAADRGGDGLFLLHGNGNGALGSATRLGTIDTPGDVAIGDFGGDENMDIAVTDRLIGEIAIFIQQPAGGFAAGARLDVSGSDPWPLDTADLNADGSDDLIALDVASDDIEVFLRNGSGFEKPVMYDVGYGATDLVVADIDSAPGLDVAVAEWSNDAISTFSGSASGALSSRVVHATGSGPAAVAVADLDADGDQDLIAPITTAGGVSVLLAKPDGSYESAFATSPGVLAPDWGLTTAQLDGNGELDLLVPEESYDSVAVLLGDVLRLEPEWLDFGEIWAGFYTNEVISVRNTGSDALSPGEATIEDGAPRFTIGYNECQWRTLLPRETCAIDVYFNALTGATGYFEGTVRVAGDAQSGPRFAAVAGSSLTRGAVAVDKSELDFGSLPYGSTMTRTITVRNRGVTSIEMGSAVTGKLPGFAVAADSCAGQTLLPTATCTIRIAFRPIPRAPARPSIWTRFWGSLHVASTDPVSSVSVSLKGKGTRPPAPPRPPSLQTTIKQALGRIALAVPKLLRGGPHGTKRLPAFGGYGNKGTISMRLRARGVLVARSTASVPSDGSSRLAFRITKKGRKLLRRPRPTRVTVLMRFKADSSLPIERKLVVTVKRPRSR